MGTERTPADTFGLLVLLVILGELLPIHLPGRDRDEVITTTPAFAFALLLVAGPTAAILAVSLATLFTYLARDVRFTQALFSIANASLALGAAGGLLSVLAELPHTTPPFLRAADLPAVLVAALVFFLATTLLHSVSYAAERALPVVPRVRQDLMFRATTTAPSLALAPMVVVAAEHTLALVPLLALPIVALYRGGRQMVLNEYQSVHDVLTGFPNRSLFYDRAKEAVLLARGQKKGRAALLVLDIDGFKEINDTLGHRNGDQFLKQIGQRIRSVLPEPTTLARLGGDEFAVLIPKVDDLASVIAITERIRSGLGLPFPLEGLRLNVNASIGIALFPEHADDVDLLMQRADVAMYVAKEARTGWAVYSEEQDPHSTERLELASDLKRAIEDQQITLHYQPKADLTTRDIIGVEVLIRWHHPDRGLIQPDEFIPLAEHTGLIHPLTLHVVEAAVAQARAWLDVGLELKVAVNLSSRILLDLHFPDYVEEILKKWNFPSSWLVFEITESVIMTDPMRALSVLDVLSEMGISISVDDYGTGYSSLSYLKRLPVDELKIDKSFVRHMTEDENDAVIVRSTVDLGRNLGLKVVAEGVETQEQWDQLAALGCDLAQGYILTPPISAGDLMQMLRARGLLETPSTNGNTKEKKSRAAPRRKKTTSPRAAS